MHTVKITQKKRGLALLVAAIMLMTLLPGTVSAETGMREDVPAMTPNSTVVGFAGYEWYVLDNSPAGVYPQANSVTLLAKGDGTPDGPFGISSFRSVSFTPLPGYGRFEDGENSRYWENDYIWPSDYVGGTLQRKMESIANGFPAKEAAFINSRTIVGDDYMPDAPAWDPRTAPNQKLWPLSYDEYAAVDDATVGSYGRFWWLRSRRAGTRFSVHFVTDEGVSNSGTYDGAAAGITVRPALSLNLASVLFTSEASGAGMKSAAVGGGLVSASAPASPVKFTMKDNSRTLDVIATPEQRTQTADTLSFTYENAATGANTYVSCVLTKGGEAVKYYGKLADTASAASGSLSIPLAGVADGTYTLKVFSEQDNGANYTDFAGTPVTMKVKVADGSGTVSDFRGTEGEASEYALTYSEGALTLGSLPVEGNAYEETTDTNLTVNLTSPVGAETTRYFTTDKTVPVGEWDLTDTDDAKDARLTEVTADKSYGVTFPVGFVGDATLTVGGHTVTFHVTAKRPAAITLRK
ncbi:MAG: hypothetical protein LBL36_03665, partial [Clostridiales Family XIII bacterium]|nr:hypothetical protein [Clostridiales Family XIII bacterium]